MNLVESLPLPTAVVTNIASLVVGYDMRRLNDITAFRRYWYRTSLVETLFIGSKKTTHPQPVADESRDGPGTSDDSATGNSVCYRHSPAVCYELFM